MPDDAKIWAALITGGLSLFGVIYVAILNYLSRREQDRFKATTDKELATIKSDTEKGIARLKADTAEELARLNADLETERDERLAQREAEKLISKFRGPLMHAAYDLQSRIWNILKKSFLTKFYTDGSDRDKEYAVQNTVFLVAQFLGWTELIRQEIQFLDLGSDNETRNLRNLQDSMYRQFQTDDLPDGFRVFAGEQRAIGELMIVRTGDLRRCIGFAAFLEDRNPNLDYWLGPLREDVKGLADDLKSSENRLVGIQHRLIDLLEFLDPTYVYFPKDNRGKIQRPAKQDRAPSS